MKGFHDHGITLGDFLSRGVVLVEFLRSLLNTTRAEYCTSRRGGGGGDVCAVAACE